jgi:hypothetical protein
MSTRSRGELTFRFPADDSVIRRSLRRALARPVMPYLGAAIAVALALPTLGNGLFMDDFVQRDRARGATSALSVQCTEAFAFLPDSETVNAAKQMGILPWYTSDDLRLSLWRPLASLTHCADYVYWPNATSFMHLENVLWLGAAALAVGLLFRSVMRPATAGVAILFYAVHASHGAVVGWLANRNAVMATCFAALAVWGYALSARSRSRWVAAFSVASFGCSLGSAEAGIETLGYLLAFALFLDDRPWRRRAWWLLPYGVVTVGWLCMYRALGHGTYGSADYIDPLRAPLVFARAVPRKLPVLLLAACGGPSATWVASVSDRAQCVWAIGAFAVLSAVGVLLLPFLRRSANGRFWAVGAAAAAIVCCCGPLSDRTLCLPAVGASAVAAEFIVAVPFGAVTTRSVRRQSVSMVVALVWLLACGALAPASSLGRSRHLAALGASVNLGSEELYGPAASHAETVVVRDRSMVQCTFELMTALLDAKSVRSGACLSGGTARTVVHRVDEYTLSLRPADGFLDGAGNPVFWNPNSSLKRGQAIGVGFFGIKVTEVTPNGEPQEVWFRFSRRLEDPKFRWVLWNEDHYEPFGLPSTGAEVVLPSAVRTVGI